VYLCICMYVCINIYVRVYTWFDVCVYLHTCTCVYIVRKYSTLAVYGTLSRILRSLLRIYRTIYAAHEVEAGEKMKIYVRTYV